MRLINGLCQWHMKEQWERERELKGCKGNSPEVFKWHTLLENDTKLYENNLRIRTQLWEPFILCRHLLTSLYNKWLLSKHEA